MMGSGPGERNEKSLGFKTPVTITQPYWMAANETTVGQWRKFVEETDYVTTAEQGKGVLMIIPDEGLKYKSGSSWRNLDFEQNEQHPVAGVSWNDAVVFTDWLNQREEKNDRLPVGYRYSLPTGAQWEYACRAGTTTAYHFGSDIDYTLANFSDAAHLHPEVDPNLVAREKTMEVGSFESNAWGLYDMHGNVSEYSLNRYSSDYPDVPLIDPQGPRVGYSKTEHGGGWRSLKDYVTSAQTVGPERDRSENDTGFRIALVPVPSRQLEAIVLDEYDITLEPISMGAFRMGAEYYDGGHQPDEAPARLVTISRSFWMGATEVSQGQWRRIMGGTPVFLVALVTRHQLSKFRGSRRWIFAIN